MVLLSEYDGAISATASTARNGQYQWLQRGNRSAPPGGRHNASSASRIGYSAIHENANGAISPANNPPSMPPNDSATEKPVRYLAAGRVRANSPWHAIAMTKKQIRCPPSVSSRFCSPP